MQPKNEMLERGGFEIKSSCPILRMLDEGQAKRFYLDYLGFQVDWECRFSAEAPLFMQVRLGEACIHLDGHASSDSPISQVNIPVLGLQNYCDHLIAKRTGYMTPCLVDPRYVGRDTDMNIEDPFGNLLIFSCQTTEG